MTSHSLVPMAAAAADLSLTNWCVVFCGGANERPLVEDILLPLLLSFLRGGVAGHRIMVLQTVEVNCAVALRKTGDSRLRNPKANSAPSKY